MNPSSVIRPGRPAFRCAMAMYRQRIASTCAVVGAVVTTNASAGGCEGTMVTRSVPERHYFPTRANRLATTGAE
jgi:hypothetical protein